MFCCSVKIVDQLLQTKPIFNTVQPRSIKHSAGELLLLSEDCPTARRVSASYPRRDGNRWAIYRHPRDISVADDFDLEDIWKEIRRRIRMKERTMRLDGQCSDQPSDKHGLLIPLTRLLWFIIEPGTDDQVYIIIERRMLAKGTDCGTGYLHPTRMVRIRVSNHFPSNSSPEAKGLENQLSKRLKLHGEYRIFGGNR